MNGVPYEISLVLTRLCSAGYEAYVVGGAVRDRLMGRPTHDYDITTSAAPEQVKALFTDRTVIATGLRHGTVTVIVGEYPVEITVFRTEGKYSDGRHPDSVQPARTLIEDLKRRDFTINAIAYSNDDKYTDYFDGISDIRSKLIRCVGDPAERFSEDYLRILRAVRFSSVLGFRVEENTKAAVHKYADKVTSVSSERIFSELCRLLCGENVKNVLTEYSDLIFKIIPELEVTYGYDQNNPNHCYTLYEHIINCVSYVEPLLHLRLAAFMHDIGKPSVMVKDSAGISHFGGHQTVSAELARGILQRLHASNALILNVCTIIKYHDVRLKPNRITVKRFISEVGIKTAKDILKLQRADSLSQSPKYYYRLNTLNKIYDLILSIEREGLAVCTKDLAVNGDDLINAGIPRGKQIGAVLKALLDEVIAEKLDNEKEALISRALKIFKTLKE